MFKLESKIESILFFKNEPVSIKNLTEWLGEKHDVVKNALTNLENSYKDRGLVLISDGENISLGTNPSASELIEKLQKEEFSRELGRAGLETLTLVLYKGPISRREIDHIRGVNSGFILRTLLVRGLIERAEGVVGDRSYTYKATLKLLEHLGVTRREELPEYETAFKKIEKFTQESLTEQDE